MKTGFYAEYELKDTTAIADSRLATAFNSSFADIVKLKDNLGFPDYATLEEDYFLLDGSHPEFPDSPDDIVFFSNVMSDGSGRFARNPTFVVDFTENHTSIGLTLHFVGDYPLEMKITWRDLTGTYLDSMVCEPDRNVCYIHRQVEDYGKLEIEFTRTKPYRYIKLRYLEYGTDIVFGKDGFPVKDASIVEEYDAISDKLSVNKLSFKVIDAGNDFNVANPGGMHRVLQKGQALKAYEEVDGKKLFLGAYFLKSNSTADSITNIACEDYMGLLDNRPYREGRVYAGEPAGNVLRAIFAAAGIENYTIDPVTYDRPLYGWLKIQTCRKALREVLFAAGAVADTGRSDCINVFRPDRAIRTQIQRSRKFSTSIKTDDYISDIAVKFSTYILEDTAKDITKGSYAAGSYTVDFSSPVYGLSINTGRITAQSTNYVSFVLDTAADVVIQGRKYAKEDLTVTASVTKVAAGENRKEKSFTGTLLNMQSAQEAAERILDHYSLQQILSIKFLNTGDAVSQWAEVGNPVGTHGNFVAGFEKMTTDLTGGFVTTAQLRGYYKLLTDYDYTGELYTDDAIGEM